MSYDPTEFGEQSVLFAVFNAHSTQAQVVGVAQPFSFDTASGASTTADGQIETKYKRTYCVGEIRTDGATSEYNLCDIEIAANTGEIAQGYQVRNNANGTVLMDDACYAVTVTSPFTIRMAQSGAGSEGRSVALETRVMGVFTL